MTSDSIPTYLMAPSTCRSADKVSQHHGYKNAEHLAENLREGSRIIDVGSGFSNFGEVVVGILGSSVDWTNFDLCFNPSTDTPPQLPDNLHNVHGNVFDIQEIFGCGQFDYVFCNFMMQYFSLITRRPAVRAARGIIDIAKDGGSIYVGPARRPRASMHIVKHLDLDIDQCADDIARRTRLNLAVRAFCLTVGAYSIMPGTNKPK